MTTQLVENVVRRHVQSRSPRRQKQDAVVAYLVKMGMIEVDVGGRGLTLVVFPGTDAEIVRNVRLDVEVYGWAERAEWNENLGVFFIHHTQGLGFIDPTTLIFGESN